MKTLQPPNSHHLSAAIGWLGLGNWQEAQADIEKITPVQQTHPAVLKVRLQIYDKAKNWEKAIEVARIITKQTPDSPFGWFHLAFALHELRLTQEAYDTLKPVCERFPDKWLMRYNLACYACQLGKLEETRHWLKLAFACGDEKKISRLILQDPDLKPLLEDTEDISKLVG